MLKKTLKRPWKRLERKTSYHHCSCLRFSRRIKNCRSASSNLSFSKTLKLSKSALTSTTPVKTRKFRRFAIASKRLLRWNRQRLISTTRRLVIIASASWICQLFTSCASILTVRAVSTMSMVFASVQTAMSVSVKNQINDLDVVINFFL